MGTRYQKGHDQSLTSAFWLTDGLGLDGWATGFMGFDQKQVSILI
jgi:hypothetical protein